ncbi:hypothetical protein Pan241w_14760 [Gimesia alba]|uniref:Uncharacterized protein n=1 Tax=Gimesia alba TaxID=2527973 RepID=A0A517RC27_9PLAN|nr:hypothetical protein Pan241w_14760 [Gimesia alba]
MWLKQGTFIVLIFAAVPVLYLNLNFARARRTTQHHADGREAVKSGLCSGQFSEFSCEEVERSRICGLWLFEGLFRIWLISSGLRYRGPCLHFPMICMILASENDSTVAEGARPVLCHQPQDRTLRGQRGPDSTNLPRAQTVSG